MMSYLIYMAIRLTEMRRILKPTGSIFLHCDDTAGPYLRLVMDAVFGARNFRNEVVWRRHSGRSDAKRFGRVHDRLLYYAPQGRTWHTQYQPHDPEYVNRAYRHDDNDGRGRWRSADLTASGLRAGESGMPWRNVDPGEKGNHWRTPTQGGMNDFIIERNLIPNWPDAYPSVHARLEALDRHRLIHWPKRGSMPSLKRYLASTKGTAATDLWTDIKRLESTSKENTDYPTQKPVALVERIIKASSNEGDMVLDPFCGCATACIAAERLGRKWIGIDISALAADLVQSRMQTELGLLFYGSHRTDIPRRTDLGEIPPYNSMENRKWLYGEQGGYCLGCGHHFLMRNLTVDHIIARSRGGTDHISNLQLLCAACNSTKGKGSQAELLARLINKGIRKPQQTNLLPDDLLPVAGSA